VEVDGGDEVGFAAETASGVLDPLNLRIDGLAGGVGNAMPQIGNDVLDAALDQCAPFFDHAAQSAASRPVMPPAEAIMDSFNAQARAVSPAWRKSVEMHRA
jgi:hypothetical protein